MIQSKNQSTQSNCVLKKLIVKNGQDLKKFTTFLIAGL